MELIKVGLFVKVLGCEFFVRDWDYLVMFVLIDLVLVVCVMMISLLSVFLNIGVMDKDGLFGGKWFIW